MRATQTVTVKVNLKTSLKFQISKNTSNKNIFVYNSKLKANIVLFWTSEIGEDILIN